MSHSNQGAVASQVESLQRQFAQAPGLPFADLLPTALFTRLLQEQDVVFHGFDYNPTVHHAFPASSEFAKFSEGQDGAKVFRNTQIVAYLLKDQDSHTILCTCTLYGKTYELRFSDSVESKRSISSSCVSPPCCGPLRKVGNEITHRSLYQSISARFYTEWSRQNSMRSGNKDFSIFDADIRQTYQLIAYFFSRYPMSYTPRRTPISAFAYP